MLRIEDLSVDFETARGSVRVLHDVGLRLERGETMGLVGESGSGKSMLCRAIMRLLPQTGRISGGSIQLAGDELMARSKKEMVAVRGRRIGFIPQEPMSSLNPVLTVGTQLMEAVRRHKNLAGSELSQHSVELLRQMKIDNAEAAMGSYPHQNSGGMRQRILAAIALAGDPDLLLADEPTTALDATTQLHFLLLLREIQRRTACAVLFVTHDISLVGQLCDSVSVMYAGRIVERGPTADVFAAPKHPYTQALWRSVPRLHQNTGRLPTIPGAPPSVHDIPPGCPFNPRCPFAFDLCSEEHPPDFHIAPGWSAKCWLHEGGVEQLDELSDSRSGEER